MSSEKATILLSQGQTLLSKGDTKKAIDVLAKAVAADPTHAFAFFHYAEALDRAEQTDKALEMYRQAIKLSPVIAQEQIDMGLDMMLEGPFGRAVYEFKNGLDPGAAEEEKPAHPHGQPASVDELMSGGKPAAAAPSPAMEEPSAPDPMMAMDMGAVAAPAPSGGGFDDPMSGMFDDPMAEMSSPPPPPSTPAPQAAAPATPAPAAADPMAGMFDDPMADMAPPPAAPTPQAAAPVAPAPAAVDPMAGMFDDPMADMAPPPPVAETPTVVMELPPPPPPAVAAGEAPVVDLVFEEGGDLFGEEDLFAQPAAEVSPAAPTQVLEPPPPPPPPTAATSEEGSAQVAALFEDLDMGPDMETEGSPTMVMEAPPPPPPPAASAPPPADELADLFAPVGHGPQTEPVPDTPTVALDLSELPPLATPPQPVIPPPPVMEPEPAAADFSFGGVLPEDEPGLASFGAPAAPPPPVNEPLPAAADFSFGGALPEDEPGLASFGAPAAPPPPVNEPLPAAADFSFGGALPEDEPGLASFGAPTAPPPPLADLGGGESEGWPQPGEVSFGDEEVSAGAPGPAATLGTGRFAGFEEEEPAAEQGFSFGAAPEEEPAAPPTAPSTPRGGYDDAFSSDEDFSFGASAQEQAEAAEGGEEPLALHDDAGLDVDINIVQVADTSRGPTPKTHSADEVMGRDLGMEGNFWEASSGDDEGFGFGQASAPAAGAEEDEAPAPVASEDNDFADMFTTGSAVSRGGHAPAQESPPAPAAPPLAPQPPPEDHLSAAMHRASQAGADEFTFGGGDDHGLGDDYDFSAKPADAPPVDVSAEFSFGAPEEEQEEPPPPTPAAPPAAAPTPASEADDFLKSLGVDFSGPEDISPGAKTKTAVFTTPTESWAAMMDDMAPPPATSKAAAPWKSGKTGVYETPAPPPPQPPPTTETEFGFDVADGDDMAPPPATSHASAPWKKSHHTAAFDTPQAETGEPPAPAPVMDFSDDMASLDDLSPGGGSPAVAAPHGEPALDLSFDLPASGDSGLTLDLDSEDFGLNLTAGLDTPAPAAAPPPVTPASPPPAPESPAETGDPGEEDSGFTQTLRWLNPVTDTLEPGAIVEIQVRVDDLYGVAVEGESLTGEIVDKDMEGLTFLTPQKREGVSLYITEDFADFGGVAHFNVQLGKASGANQIKIKTMHASPLVVTFNTQGQSAVKLVMAPKGGMVPGGLNMTAFATALDAHNNPVQGVAVTFVVMEHEGDAPTFLSPMTTRTDAKGMAKLQFKVPDSPGSTLRLAAKTQDITAISVTPLMVEVKGGDTLAGGGGRYAEQPGSTAPRANPLAGLGEKLGGLGQTLGGLLNRGKAKKLSDAEAVRLRVQQKLNPTAQLQVKTVRRRVNTAALQQRLGAVLLGAVVLGVVFAGGRFVYRKVLFPVVLQHRITGALAKNDHEKLEKLYGYKKDILAGNPQATGSQWDAMIGLIAGNRVAWAKALRQQNQPGPAAEKAGSAVHAYLDTTYSSLGQKRPQTGGKALAEITPQQVRAFAEKVGAPPERRQEVANLFLGLAEAFKVRGRPGDCARAINFVQKAQWMLAVEDQSLGREVARLGNLVRQGALVCWQ